jgi:hypothetical protein
MIPKTLAGMNSSIQQIPWKNQNSFKVKNVTFWVEDADVPPDMQIFLSATTDFTGATKSVTLPGPFDVDAGASVYLMVFVELTCKDSANFRVRMRSEAN